ncbi:MAG: hypothetical protein ACREIT_01340 [Tepidisphaeraceae bacterium]
MIASRLVCLGLAGALLARLPVTVFAQTVTTAPAEPTSAPVDRSTPKGALKLLTRSLDKGDQDGILSVLYAEAPHDKKVVEAMASLAAAGAELKSAAITAFGIPGAGALVGDPAAVDAALANIDAATESVEGDRATVGDGSGMTVSLVKVDGQWRLPASTLTRGAPPEQIEQNLAEAAAHIRAIQDTTTEIGEGKHHTAQEAGQALDTRIRTARERKTPKPDGLVEDDHAGHDHSAHGQGATTHPVTAPTTTPAGE